MIIFISNQNAASAQYNYDFEKITNKLSIKVPIKAERYSDLSYKAFNNKSNLYNENLTRTDSQGLSIIDFQLGSKSDQREGCISTVNLRRTGICEDGFYTFNFIATDGAGNSGEVFEFKIERDTVAPQVPNANLSICGKDICLNITSAEPSTYVLANNSQVGQITANSHSFVVLRNFIEDSTFSYNISLIDPAQNISDPLELTIHTPSFGIGGVGDLNPYGDKSLDRFKKTYEAEFTLDSNGNLTLKSLNLEPPEITFARTDFESKDVSIYGVAPNSGFSINTNATINIETISYGNARDLCGLNFFEVPVFPWHQDCMAEKMKINKDEFKSFENKIIKDCVGLWGWEKINNSLNMIGKVNCVDDETFTKTLQQSNVNLSLNHVELILMKDNSQITSSRKCNVGAECYNNSTRYWHSNSEGKWTMEFTKDILKPQDKVKAVYKFFADFSIGIDGRQYNGSNSQWGFESPVSNEYVVPEAEANFWQKAVHPLAYDPNCKGFSRSRGVLYSGSKMTHDGVDLAKAKGCKINAFNEGIIDTAKWWGNDAAHTVIINHVQNISSFHYHGTGEYYVKSSDSVKQGDFIMHMGNTGNCISVPGGDCTHLHLTIKENRFPINFELKDKLGELSSNSYLFQKTKQYE